MSTLINPPSGKIQRLATKSITISGALTYNLFKISGVVQVNYLYGIVTTSLAADITGVYLDLDDGTVQVPITVIAGAPAVSSLPPYSFVAKANTAGNVVEVQSAATCYISEVVGNIFSKFTAGEKTGAVATYVRFVRAGAGASGVMDWYIDWEPLSTTGLVIPA